MKGSVQGEVSGALDGGGGGGGDGKKQRRNERRSSLQGGNTWCVV